MSLIHSYGKLSNMECILEPIPKEVDPASDGWWYGNFIVVEIDVSGRKTRHGSNTDFVDSLGYRACGLQRRCGQSRALL